MAKVAAESGERKRRRRACHQDVWHPRTSGSLDDVLEQPDVVVVGTEYREARNGTACRADGGNLVGTRMTHPTAQYSSKRLRPRWPRMKAHRFVFRE